MLNIDSVLGCILHSKGCDRIYTRIVIVIQKHSRLLIRGQVVENQR
jgi:hypothetical protein